MRIPGLTLLNAPSSQPSSACQIPERNEAPGQPPQQLQGVEDAHASVGGDRDAALFTQATLPLASVSQDEPLPLLQKVEEEPEVLFNDTLGGPDALDIALADESSSEPESAASDDETMRHDNPSKAVNVNGIERREGEQVADEDGSDEGYRSIVVIKLTVTDQFPEAIVTILSQT
jgi:hypothetical protein